MTYRMNCYSRFFRLEFVFLRWLHFCISSPHIRLRPSCHCAEVGTRASRKTTDTSCCLSCVEAMASSLQCCVHHSRSFWPQGSGLRLLCTCSINLYRLCNGVAIYISRPFPRLQFCLPGVSFQCLQAGKLPRIVRRFSSLEVLNLSFLFDCSELCLSAIGRNCPNLHELQLPETTSKPAVNVGSGVTVLARGCTRLRTLSLPAYRGPTEALNSIGLHLTSLQCLRLRAASGLTDVVVKEIARNCISLTELDLSFNSITGESLCHILGPFGVFARNHLTCSYARYADESLRAIGASLASLSTLDLKHCRKVTGSGIAAVAAGCRMLKVRIVSTSRSVECLQLNVIIDRAAFPVCLDRLIFAVSPPRSGWHQRRGYGGSGTV